MNNPFSYVFKLILSSISLVLLLTFGQNVHAQSTDTLQYRIVTSDGNIFTGQLQSSDSSVFVIKTAAFGIVTIDTDMVTKMYQIRADGLGKKEYWHRNIQAARYFWAPNGYGLKKGEGYYQNYWVLFNQVSYGFSDYFSAGFGMMPLFIFGGAPTPIWITPKFSIPIVQNKFNVGAGGLFGTILGENNSSFGLAYGTTTFGSREANVSLGLGWGFFDGEWGNTPLINISGIMHIGKKGTYLMTENYFINFGTDDFVGLMSFGGRSLISSMSIDYGLFIPIGIGIETFFAIPWLGITIPFKKKH